MSKDERIEEQLIGVVSDAFEREGASAAQRYRDHVERHRVDPPAEYRTEWAKIELFAGDGWCGEIKLDFESTQRLLRFLEDEPCPCWLCRRRTPADRAHDFRGFYCCHDCWTTLTATGDAEPGRG